MDQNASKVLCDEELLRRIREVLQDKGCAGDEAGDHMAVDARKLEDGGSQEVLSDASTPPKKPKSTMSSEEPAVQPTEPAPEFNEEDKLFKHTRDFQELEAGLELIQDKKEQDKVYITRTERQCFEEIGNLVSRTRVPLDEKHQKYFEKDRRRYANKILMPDTQEVERDEPMPLNIAMKTKEAPVNITSTELDGLRTYLLQLKELIARREAAWARTTERDYNQRVEITRFRNEVTHLRMLCEKRQRDVKERDQVIASKDEEICDLNKRIQGLRCTIMKIDKKDDRIMETLEGLTKEVMENSNKAKKMMQGRPPAQQKTATVAAGPSKRDPRRKALSPNKSGSLSRDDMKQHSPEPPHAKAEDKIAKIEEMLQEGGKSGKKKAAGGWKAGTAGKNPVNADLKTLIRNYNAERNQCEAEVAEKKVTLSNSKMRQEMMQALMSQGKGQAGGGATAAAAALAKALFASKQT